MGRILAIDYGTKRVGLAVTDENRLIAGPLDTIPAHLVLAFLQKYVSKEPVDVFVVGKPLQMSGEASQSMVHVEAFVRSLRKQFPFIPVEWVDERFTSKMASRAIAESGLKKKDRQDKSLIDKISAVIILQSFMEILSNKMNL
ncbi:MAG: Holliday junction resolvase RuvX [Bacteroidota bacterium]